MAETADKKTAPDKPVATVTLTIDGRQTTVAKGTTVLEAARAMGIVIPTFCWHPKLKPAGSCRMCYVEIEKMPKLQISCATEAMEGMVVHTDSDWVKRGRKAIIEFTLLDHPLDCPTCDKGGECDLQNLTFAYGLDDSRFDFQKKRHVEEGVVSTFDEIRIGPEIILNRNRCILCYRCVRANKEAFGEYDLGSYERGNHTEINAAPGSQVANPFSGNLVEICPVGALTNTDWRYKIRVWLTRTTSSVCPYTSSGTNILLYKEEHRDRIFRVTSRCNDSIDDGWLADLTRYGYQIINSPDRLERPLIKKGGKQVEASWDEALDVIQRRLTEIKDKKGSVCIGGLVSPHLDNATLITFSRFMRGVLGSNNVDYRVDYRMLPKQPGGPYDVITGRPFRIADIDRSDVIVTLGSDLVKEHPNEYLRIRKAVNFHDAMVYSINPYEVKSGDVARRELVYRPGTEEILLNGICLAAIESNLVPAERFAHLKNKIVPNTLAEVSRRCGVDSQIIREVAEQLSNAKVITFFAGEIVSRSRDREVIAAALCNVNRLFKIEDRGQIAVLAQYSNSMGAAKLGLLPEPPEAIRSELAARWGGWPEAEPLTTDKQMVHMKKEEINGCIILGGNPVMLYPDREFALDALKGLDFLVVADLFETDTTALADVVLPLAGWAEYEGNYVNLEGRNQHAARALKPSGEAKPGYEIMEAIAQRLGGALFESASERDRTVARLLELDSRLPWPSEFLEVKPAEDEATPDYPLALYMGDDPHHRGYLTEKCESLSAFCSEIYVEMSAALAEKLGVGDGDSVRIESEVGKIIAPVRISERIRTTEAVFVPRNFSATQVTSLLMRKRRVDRVKITKVVS